MKDKILYISLCLNIVLSAWLIYCIVNQSNIFSSDREESSMEVVSKKVYNEVLNDDDILFLGADRVFACDWNSLFGVRNICNAAYPSNTIEEDFERIELLLDGKTPQQVFMMYGENELLNNTAANQIVEDYTKMITQLKTILPQTEIIVFSPIPLAYYDFSTDKFNHNENYKILNLMLKLAMQEMSVLYINLEDDFLDSDGFLKECYRGKDKLKLNRKAYEVLKDRIKPYMTN